jgi:hypothetical protein
MNILIVISTVDGEISNIASKFGNPAIFLDEKQAFEYCKKNQSRRVKHQVVELTGREIPLPDFEEVEA